MKFLTGVILGAVLSAGVMSLSAQPERAMHPRIAAAISALKDARAYMENAPHDFGGHKAAAMRSTGEAIRDLNEALRFPGPEDRRPYPPYPRGQHFQRIPHNP